MESQATYYTSSYRFGTISQIPCGLFFTDAVEKKKKPGGCEVCGKNDFLFLMVCGKCGVTVHNYCYDVSGFHQPWICQSCLFQEFSEMKPQCCICKNSEGALRRYPSGWIHSICVKWPSFSKTSRKPCSICSVYDSNIVSCNDCGVSYHPYCGYKRGLKKVGNAIKCENHEASRARTETNSNKYEMETDGDCLIMKLGMPVKRQKIENHKIDESIIGNPDVSMQDRQNVAVVEPISLNVRVVCSKADELNDMKIMGGMANNYQIKPALPRDDEQEADLLPVGNIRTQAPVAEHWTRMKDPQSTVYKKKTIENYQSESPKAVKKSAQNPRTGSPIAKEKLETKKKKAKNPPKQTKSYLQVASIEEMARLVFDKDKSRLCTLNDDLKKLLKFKGKCSQVELSDKLENFLALHAKMSWKAYIVSDEHERIFGTTIIPFTDFPEVILRYCGFSLK